MNEQPPTFTNDAPEQVDLKDFEVPLIPDREITDQEFKAAVIMGLQTCSNHLAALVLSAKKPNPDYNPRKPPKVGNTRTIPLSPDELNYHLGMQHMFNNVFDKLLGADAQEQKMKPSLAVDNTKNDTEEKT